MRALDPLLAWAYADGAGGATFGALRLVDQPVPAVTAGRGHGRDVSDRLALVRAAAPAQAARDAGALYAANTVGAAIGALPAGFVLLPSSAWRGDVGRRRA